MAESKSPVASESSGNHSNSVQDVDLRKELWDSTAVDPVLAKKMALINSGIDEIGSACSGTIS